MADRPRVGGDAEVRLAEDGDDRKGEHDAQERQRPAFEEVDEVVPQGRDCDLGDERLQGEGPADAVDDEPADRPRESIQARRQDVAEEAERTAALDHHRDAELRAP